MATITSTMIYSSNRTRHGAHRQVGYTMENRSAVPNAQATMMKSDTCCGATSFESHSLIPNQNKEP
ncbi:hypothetical protein M378DRAFT_169980 [Amanita muscaria Koide BX008]|uniref:Uncharacterized protein n=1 Tax=Amanita muscaria (strain Koide BX008) TaxID=946122 RepID=A0A0C2WC73_AMAMK|nr:hypothetical protein M378DRAFT_169980 [Amanita muscaria Koide BX008]